MGKDIKIMYPEAFKRRIRESFPVTKQVVELAENNQYVLGIALAKIAAETIEPEEVLEIVKSKDKANNLLAALIRKAQEIVSANKLYDEWLQIRENKRKSISDK